MSTLVRTVVCALADLTPDRGSAALITGPGGTEQVAVFRLASDEVYAVAQRDPFSGAYVMARGLVGTRLVDGVEVPTVASPIYKQVFDLRTGACLEAVGMTAKIGDGALRTWRVSVEGGAVAIEEDAVGIDAVGIDAVAIDAGDAVGPATGGAP